MLIFVTVYMRKSNNIWIFEAVQAQIKDKLILNVLYTNI